MTPRPRGEGDHTSVRVRVRVRGDAGMMTSSPGGSDALDACPTVRRGFGSGCAVAAPGCAARCCALSARAGRPAHACDRGDPPSRRAAPRAGRHQPAGGRGDPRRRAALQRGGAASGGDNTRVACDAGLAARPVRPAGPACSHPPGRGSGGRRAGRQRALRGAAGTRVPLRRPDGEPLSHGDRRGRGELGDDRPASGIPRGACV